jgi:hypothetical protein
MYLVDKSPGGATYRPYFEKVSKRSGSALKPFITERSLRFARVWFAKKAVEERGWRKSKGWGTEGILENTMEEFDERHRQNEKTAPPSNKVESLVDGVLQLLNSPIK